METIGYVYDLESLSSHLPHRALGPAQAPMREAGALGARIAAGAWRRTKKLS